MATVGELNDALQDFAERFAAEPRLKVMNSDWNRIIHVDATDLEGDGFAVTVQGGELRFEAGRPAAPQMVLRADAETLTDLFYGDLSPTEAYMDGRIKIEASEDDMMRLDVITLMLWDE